MGRINIGLFKKLLNLDIELEKIEEFKNEYSKIKSSVRNHEELTDLKKISVFNKDKHLIIDFSSKYKDMINIFQEKDLLYEMTNGFELSYHWEDLYKNLFLEIKKVGKEKIVKVLDFLEKNGYREIEFVKSILGIYYEKFNKRFNEEKYEIEYYVTDGEKIYLSQYYADVFPVIFKNSNILLNYRTGNLFGNGKTVILSTFDIDINKLKCIDDEKQIVDSIQFDKIKELSAICRQLRTMEEEIVAIQTSIESTKKLLLYSDLKQIANAQIEKSNEIIAETKKQKELLINTYCSIGYNKEIIEESLKYLKKAEWNSSIDYC